MSASDAFWRGSVRRTRCRRFAAALSVLLVAGLSSCDKHEVGPGSEAPADRLGAWQAARAILLEGAGAGRYVVTATRDGHPLSSFHDDGAFTIRPERSDVLRTTIGSQSYGAGKPVTLETRRVDRTHIYLRTVAAGECWSALQPSDVDAQDILGSILPPAVLVLTTAVAPTDPLRRSLVQGHVAAIVMLRAFGMPASDTRSLRPKDNQLPVPVNLLLTEEGEPAGFVADGADVARALRAGGVGLQNSLLNEMRRLQVRMTLRDLGVDPEIVVPPADQMTPADLGKCPSGT